MRDIVEFSLISWQVGKSVRLEFFVVVDIASIQKEHVELIKGNYHYFHRIYFSDICSNEEALQVDILVGSNYVLIFSKGKQYKGASRTISSQNNTWLGASLPMKGGKT